MTTEEDLNPKGLKRYPSKDNVVCYVLLKEYCSFIVIYHTSVINPKCTLPFRFVVEITCSQVEALKVMKIALTIIIK